MIREMTRFLVNPRLLSTSVLLFIFFISMFMKIFFFVHLTVFDYHDDTALFWTESAFQYRYARMVAHGDPLPSIDYKVQHPEGLKIFSHITIAMELFSGYLYQFFSIVFPHLPFHVFLIYFICLFSSVSIFAVYFITQELWDNRIASILSSAFYAFNSTGFDRTIGNYSREDFCLPFIFFGLLFFIVSNSDKKSHCICFKKNAAPILSGLFMSIALSSWHFSRFYFLIFTLLVTIIFFIREENKLLMRNFGVIILFSFIAGITIPVLKEKSFITSYPMITSYCLIALYWLQKIFHLSRMQSILLFIPVLIISVLLTALFTDTSLAYSHVYSLLLYKLRFFGIKPDDPTLLPYSTKSLWIEAFNSPSLHMIVYSFSTLLPISIISLFCSLKGLLRKIVTPNEEMLLYFTAVFSVLYLLITRMSVFLIFSLSLFVGKTLHTRRKNQAYVIIALLTVCVTFEFHKSINMNKPTYFDTWIKKYLMVTPDPPPYGSLRDRLKLIDWIRNTTDESDVILTWFGTGPMIITDTGRSIVLHSKFETEQIRKKYKEFAFSLFDSEENFFKFCQKYQVDYFLYEAQFVLDKSKDSIRYVTNQLSLAKDTVAYQCHFEPEKLTHLTLVYQNASLRVFLVNDKGEIPDVTFKQSYQALFDIKQFERNHHYGMIFDDSKTAALIKKRYLGKRIFVSGVMHQEQGKIKEAIKAYKRTITLVPDLIEAYARLGDIYYQEGFATEGFTIFKKALQLDPNDESTYNKLAWIYATSPNAAIRNGDKAVALATKACELTGFQKAEALDTLAAAYAEQGNFEKAMDYQHRAIELASPHTVGELQNRLQLYTRGHKYRD